MSVKIPFRQVALQQEGHMALYPQSPSLPSAARNTTVSQCPAYTRKMCLVFVNWLSETGLSVHPDHSD